MGKNLKNAAVAFMVATPSLVFYVIFLAQYRSRDNETLQSWWKWCVEHPLLLANSLFFVNIDVLFWIIGQIQSSHWMIDLYWTIIPLLLVYYHATFPWAQYSWLRSRLVMVMTWLWSVRLTHNYFRREAWQWGAREDWRFHDMRRQHSSQWWWLSFFSVYVSQQILLMGLCFPFYIVHSHDKPLNLWDCVAVAVCLCGIVIAYHADTQLHQFVTRKQPSSPVLQDGLWYYCRHPNYFGEQLWWWGVAMFAWNLGYPLAFTGALLNSLCLAYVIVLVEQRMMKPKNRGETYQLYRKTTSAWIPWFTS